MASSIQLLRSTIAQERPFPANLLEGQPAVNLNASEPGLFFKVADGSLVKFGPAAITSDGSPPNSSPQGASGNTIGELWLDKSINPPVLKVYDGVSWIDAGSGGGGGGGGGTIDYVRWIYTAIGGETSLSGTSGGVALLYIPGVEEVFVNGVLLTRGTDYSATNGTSITNLAPLTAGDVVTVISLNPPTTIQLPGRASLLRWSVLATNAQTTLSGNDTSGQLLEYVPGYEQVFVNGALLRSTDYTASSGTTIVLASPLSTDDEVTVIAFSEFTVGSVSTNDIQPLAVTEAKLADGAVTDAKVSSDTGDRINSTKVSFLQGSSAAVKRSVREKLLDVVNAKDFGAVGDGVTDDTDAIRQAIGFCSTNQRPILNLGVGEFVVDGLLLDSRRGVTIKGETGRDPVDTYSKTRIIWKAGSTSDALLTLRSCANMTWENISFKINGNTGKDQMILFQANGDTTPPPLNSFANLNIDFIACCFDSGSTPMGIATLYTKSCGGITFKNCFLRGGPTVVKLGADTDPPAGGTGSATVPDGRATRMTFDGCAIYGDLQRERLINLRLVSSTFSENPIPLSNGQYRSSRMTVSGNQEVRQESMQNCGVDQFGVTNIGGTFYQGVTNPSAPEGQFISINNTIQGSAIGFDLHRGSYLIHNTSFQGINKPGATQQKAIVLNDGIIALDLKNNRYSVPGLNTSTIKGFAIDDQRTSYEDEERIIARSLTADINITSNAYRTIFSRTLTVVDSGVYEASYSLNIETNQASTHEIRYEVDGTEVPGTYTRFTSESGTNVYRISLPPTLVFIAQTLVSSHEVRLRYRQVATGSYPTILGNNRETSAMLVFKGG